MPASNSSPQLWIKSASIRNNPERFDCTIMSLSVSFIKYSYVHYKQDFLVYDQSNLMRKSNNRLNVLIVLFLQHYQTKETSLLLLSLLDVEGNLWIYCYSFSHLMIAKDIVSSKIAQFFSFKFHLPWSPQYCPKLFTTSQLVTLSSVPQPITRPTCQYIIRV